MNAEQLKTSILQQAIEGKLVPQLDSEESVEQIGDAPEEVPFAIPEKWKWFTLGSVIEYGKCNQLAGNEITSETWVLDLEDIEKNTGRILEKKRGVSTTSNKNKFEEGFVLYSKLRPYLNKVVIADESGVCTTEIVPINVASAKVPLLARYLQCYLMSPLFLNHANQASYGVKMPRLGTKDARAALIPIPPVEEQSRIVTRIEELLPLVEAYGKSYDRLQELNAELPGKLKASILQEAIQGKLVPQLDSEEATEQIGDAPEEVPFAIPEKWKWVQLKSVGTVIGGGTPKTSVSEYWGDDVSWITPADLGKNSSKWIHKGAKSITQKGLNESSAKLMPEGSVVYSSRAPIGHIAIAGQELCTNQGCKSFVPNEEVISTEWAYYMLIARTKDIQSRASGTTFKEISGKGVGETWITLPPLEEQKRIVAKIEDLLKQVDALSAR